MRTRWLAIVLGVSVALNLFFLGFLSARAFHRSEARVEPPRHGAPGPHSRRARQRSRSFDWMTEAQRDELRPRRRELRVARHAVEDALRAEPFDRDKLRQSLVELRRQTDGIQGSVHDYMLQRAEVMSRDERRRLAESQSHVGR